MNSFRWRQLLTVIASEQRERGDPEKQKVKNWIAIPAFAGTGFLAMTAAAG